MRHRTSAQTKSIEAEVQARRQAAYQAMLDKRHAEEYVDLIRRGEVCGLSNHGAGGCSDPNCPTRRQN